MPGNTMWFEARKQEKYIRGLMVDYKKRAERRQSFYEKVKRDPAQFLQVHGRKLKINVNSSEAQKAESSSVMMPWQGDTSNMIDRFDVRANLDQILQYTGSLRVEQTEEELRCEYERYRMLIQNEFLGVTMEQCLDQIYLEEMFPSQQNQHYSSKKFGGDYHPHAKPKAAIAYQYTENDLVLKKHSRKNRFTETEESSSDESDSDIELDVTLNADALDIEQKSLLNTYSAAFGMKKNVFLTLLAKDKDDQENARVAKQIEDEKAMYSGRKSRRKRREFHERRMLDRSISPTLSYAAPKSPSVHSDRYSSSRSPSPPEDLGKVEFISAFCKDESSGVSKPVAKFGPSRHSKTQDDRYFPLSTFADNSQQDESPSAESSNQVVKRYRRKSLSSSDEFSLSGSEEESLKKKSPSPEHSKPVSSLFGKPKSTKKNSLMSKLQKRMENQLNKRIKEDRHNQRIKDRERDKEIQEREDEIRMIARRMRERERRRRSRSDSRSPPSYRHYRGSRSKSPPYYRRSPYRYSRRSRSRSRDRWY